ncbi:NAD(P)H-dependent oxidoreductase, partial [Acinetobacter baumannii]|uniref:NAD(P)H-dependent oxidoreductase n=1 Tax=Acinetobacter baumannii TaxID=470 RepID=UPI0014901D4F
MKVLVLYCHPNPESYGAALHRAVVETLVAKGHEVDDCDLYAEGFDPVLTRAERAGYHDLESNI